MNTEPTMKLRSRFDRGLDGFVQLVNARRPTARISNRRSHSGARHREHFVTVPATEETDIVHLPDADDAQGAFTERTRR